MGDVLKISSSYGVLRARLSVHCLHDERNATVDGTLYHCTVPPMERVVRSAWYADTSCIGGKRGQPTFVP